MKVIISSSIVSSPSEPQPKVDSTLTLPPTCVVDRSSSLNFVFVAIAKSPFTLASFKMISYSSSPSYLPS